MLDYDSAQNLYDAISAKAASCGNPDFLKYYTSFLRSAVSYAATRTDWHFMDAAERMEQDAGRTRKHDGYMSYLSSVCNYLDVQDIDMILPDRKAKGDFACYIVLFLALEQR